MAQPLTTWLARLRPELSLWVGVWLAYMIALPVIDAVTAGAAYAGLATLGVVAQAAASWTALQRAWPVRRLVGAAALVAGLTWLAEWIGSTTGWPFGVYAYTDRLQPQLAGVPVLIPLAWGMMLPPAWAVASALVDPRRRLAFAAVAALAFTAWDLYLDPQMVARGLWVWAQPSGYFGIPWINFFGWWLTATVVTWCVAPRDLEAAVRPLAVIYTLTWLLQAVGQGVFWGQPGPAAVGFVAMGVFAVLFWRRPAR